MRWIVLLSVWLWADAAAAGAWPRERGAVFVAISQTRTEPRAWGSEAQVYVEYGLGRDWTAEFALTRSAGGTRGHLVLARSFLLAGEARLSLGAGVVASRAAATPARRAARLSASLGRGFGGRLPGWTSVDLVADLSARRRDVKMVATLGIKPRSGPMGILQLQAERAAGQRITHAVAGAVWTLRPGVQVELGLRRGLARTPTREIKLATWLTF